MVRRKNTHGDELTTLHLASQELRSLRRTCQKLERGMKLGEVPHERWSKAMEQRNRLFANIARIPISTVEDVIARYEAVAMELIDDNLILDAASRRRVIVLRRDLRRLLPRL